jgi:hypothetical protein
MSGLPIEKSMMSSPAARARLEDVHFLDDVRRQPLDAVEIGLHCVKHRVFRVKSHANAANIGAIVQRVNTRRVSSG